MLFLQDPQPTNESYWRSIILFGQNVASYKFALGETLLEFAQQGTTTVQIEDLALPYARRIAAHTATARKQATARTSQFLDACYAYSQGTFSDAQLRTEAVRRGFTNVIDAFHIVNRGATPVRFFVDERQQGRLVLTDELLEMARGEQSGNLPHEIDARWRLVEAAWALGVSAHLLQVQTEANGEALYVPSTTGRRISVVSSRAALNGYQKGKCFYCFAPINIDAGDEQIADVDHCFPHTLLAADPTLNINGVWNLVLACQRCNRGDDGKFARIPAPRLVERLHRRNNYFVESHHPLRETIMLQLGQSEAERAAFLQRMYQFAKDTLLHTWEPREELGMSF